MYTYGTGFNPLHGVIVTTYAVLTIVVRCFVCMTFHWRGLVFVIDFSCCTIDVVCVEFHDVFCYYDKCITNTASRLKRKHKNKSFHQ